MTFKHFFYEIQEIHRILFIYFFFGILTSFFCILILQSYFNFAFTHYVIATQINYLNKGVFIFNFFVFLANIN